MELTMVKLRRETVEKLKSLKDYERETYDDVISKMVAVQMGELSREDIKSIEEGLADLKAGRVHSSKDAAIRLGITPRGK
ncbi:MAG: hypothetical protein V1702_02430 [Candidatus Woesearchaeota archaeon]